MGKTISFACGCTAEWEPQQETFILETYCSEHGEVYDSMNDGFGRRIYKDIEEAE